MQQVSVSRIQQVACRVHSLRSAADSCYCSCLRWSFKRKSSQQGDPRAFAPSASDPFSRFGYGKWPLLGRGGVHSNRTLPPIHNPKPKWTNRNPNFDHDVRNMKYVLGSIDSRERQSQKSCTNTDDE